MKGKSILNWIVHYIHSFSTYIKVQLFLGLVTYLTKFINDYSTKTAAICELLHKQFMWSTIQQKGFNELKLLLKKMLILSYNNFYGLIILWHWRSIRAATIQ